jgi:hypothetical protein
MSLYVHFCDNQPIVIHTSTQMLPTFSHHLNLSTDTTESFLAQSLTSLMDSPELKEILGALDTNLLKDSLPTAGVLLAQHLPPFYDWLQTELNVQRVPDSPDHTTKWVVGFLNNQESLMRLVELHRPIPRVAMERAIPRLISIFDNVEPIAIRQEWQQAIAALCLILAVAARENAPA